jgi:hypothetical protein
MYKYIVIIATALLFCAQTSKAQSAAYFFFELQPTKADVPYYFSQTLKISYNDSLDLKRQMRNYFHELKMAVNDEKSDTLHFKELIPPGSDTPDHCDAIRVTLMTSLSSDKHNVILKNIHE